MSQPDNPSEPIAAPALWRRLPPEIALAGHLVVCVAILVLAPRGFPVTHPRFWLLLGFPVLLFLLGAWGLAALLKLRGDPARWALLVMSGGWIGLSLAAGRLFPVSVGDRWVLGLLPAGATLMAAASLLGKWRGASLASAAIGCLLGLFAACAARGPEPTTRPLGSLEPPAWRPTQQDLVAARGGQLRLTAGKVSVTLDPLLRFDRVSPDRFLSLVAPEPVTEGIGEVVGDEVRFASGATLRVGPREDPLRQQFAAATPVAEEMYTHLNTYSHLTLRVEGEPWVRFSPCPEQRIPIRLVGYPTGSPATFACLGEDGVFQVLKASSGEKGPFEQLASGPLERGEPLTLWFGWEDADRVSLRLDDWSAQLSTALSPTAGWGAPQNAIEFQLSGLNNSVEVWITLAATSVGRGWDTVGHTPGVYLNRGELAILAPEPEQETSPSDEQPIGGPTDG